MKYRLLQEWLKKLVNDDVSLSTKRILLSKLMEENHSIISNELSRIRFSGEIMQADQNFRTLSEEELKRIKTENGSDFDDECIDLSDLPDELFANIERFIKKEIPGTYI